MGVETGIVRKLDELGRVVLPVELRRTLSLEPGASVEIVSEGGGILVRRYEESCVFCGGRSELARHKGRRVCSCCLEELSHREALSV